MVEPLEEIRNHIIDQRDAFIGDGLNEEEATASFAGLFLLRGKPPNLYATTE